MVGGSMRMRFLTDEESVNERRRRECAKKGTVAIAAGSGIDYLMGNGLERLGEYVDLFALQSFGSDLTQVSAYMLWGLLPTVVYLVSEWPINTKEEFILNLDERGREDLISKLQEPILPLRRT